MDSMEGENGGMTSPSSDVPSLHPPTTPMTPSTPKTPTPGIAPQTTDLDKVNGKDDGDASDDDLDGEKGLDDDRKVSYVNYIYFFQVLPLYIAEPVLPSSLVLGLSSSYKKFVVWILELVRCLDIYIWLKICIYYLFNNFNFFSL